MFRKCVLLMFLIFLCLIPTPRMALHIQPFYEQVSYNCRFHRVALPPRRLLFCQVRLNKRKEYMVRLEHSGAPLQPSPPLHLKTSQVTAPASPFCALGWTRFSGERPQSLALQPLAPGFCKEGLGCPVPPALSPVPFHNKEKLLS